MFDVPEDMRDSFIVDGNLPKHSCTITLRTFANKNLRAVSDSVLAVAQTLTGAPRTVVDLGASVGAFSGLVKGLYYRFGTPLTLWAYEPSPLLFSYLVRNVMKIPGNVDFHPLQLAVWDRTASLHVMRQIGSPEQAGLVFRDDCRRTGLAMTIHIDDALQIALDLGGGVVDVLKVDVEGAEYVFLPKVAPEILAKVRLLILDTHDVRDGSYFAPEFEKHWVDFAAFLPAQGFEPVEFDPPVPLWRNTRFS
jgi:FkbM family methyltransferase